MTRIQDRQWFGPPTPGQHRAYVGLLRMFPALDDARLMDGLAHLNVELHWSTGQPAAERVAAVEAVAAGLGLPVLSSVGNRQPRRLSLWVDLTRNRQRVLVQTVVCECHDGLAAVVAAQERHAPDPHVIDRAVGTALREILPKRTHKALAEAETIAAAERALAEAVAP